MTGMMEYTQSYSIHIDSARPIDITTSTANIALFPVDFYNGSPWGALLINTDHILSIDWIQPAPNDVHKNLIATEGILTDLHMSVNYNEPGSKDRMHSVPWGPYSYYINHCGGNDYYEPPLPCSVSFSFPNKYELNPGICKDITFTISGYNSPVNCKYKHWQTGSRDINPGLVVGNRLQYPTSREVYYMLNQVLVKEIITNKPIEVMSVTATTDRDSWLWQFQVTVASRDCLEAIMPVDGVYVTIEININGYSWLCTVESWSEDRQFSGDTWTVNGRSPSIIFGNPISQKKSDTITSGWNGQQLFDNVVTSKVAPSNWPASISDWTSDWTQYQISNTSEDFEKYTATVQTGFNPLTDWFIPPSTLSYTEKTEIEVLQDISGAIGAYIYTEPNSTVLTVRPMYAQQPWNWTYDNDQISWKPIIEDMCEAIGKTSKLYPYYERIHVAGEAISSNADTGGTGPDPSSQATFVNVFKTGYPNGDLAPMVTHPLITTSKAGLEKGRMVIGKVGEWYEHTLRLNVLCPEPSPMGLFIPGDMISVLERTVPWHGQVTGVSVVAASTAGGIVVNQIITAEQYVWS